MIAKFKKGDHVLIIAGSYKGKTGRVLSTTKSKIVVEGINLATVHQKPSSQNPGKITKIEKPIHISNVSHIEAGRPIKTKVMVERSSGDIGSGKEVKKLNKKFLISKKTGNKVE